MTILNAMNSRALAGTTIALALQATTVHAQASAPMKAAAQADVDAQAKQTQVMIDRVFSFTEPGFQEIRTLT